MELRHLRYFVAVAEELNFSRAAERLHIAQPPLSIQIRALENEIRVQLFERDKRRVYLTPAGMQFLERARSILRDVELAKDEALSAATGQVGRLSVGYTASSMLSPQLPAAICRFRQGFPQVFLELHEQTSLDQLVAIHERRLDLGVLRRPNVSIPVGVSVTQWYQSPLLAAIPKGHRLSGGPIRISDLDGETLITYPRDSGIGLYWKVQDLCSRAGIQVRQMYEIKDVANMVGLVAAGTGVALVPEGASCIRSDGVVYQRVQDKEAVSSLYLAYRSVVQNTFVAEMIKLLCSERGGGD